MRITCAGMKATSCISLWAKCLVTFSWRKQLEEHVVLWASCAILGKETSIPRLFVGFVHSYHTSSSLTFPQVISYSK